jgi:hypothetical protein
MSVRAPTPRRSRVARICRRVGAAVAVSTLLAGCRAVKEVSENTQPFSLTTGVIRGRVLDQPTGSALAGASVHLIDRAGADVQDQTAVAYVDNDGKYTFPNVRPGTYRLRAEGPNHEPETSDEFVMDVNMTFGRDFSLRPK